MAWIVGDSFDYYVNASDFARSVWDTVPSAPGLGIATNHPPRFLPGQCITVGGVGVTATKAIGSNVTTIHVAVAAYMEGAPTGAYVGPFFQFLDAGTAQCTIVFEGTGNILLKRGDQNGTVVATYAAAIQQDVWTHWQLRVVIDPAAGTFTVRKNGSPTDSFSATGLNTRSTANSFANSLAFGTYSSFVNTFRLDDLCFFSATGAAPNTWTGDTRAVCLMPNKETAQKNFATNPTVPTSVFGNPGLGFTTPVAANVVTFCGPYAPTQGGYLTKATVIGFGAATGTVKAGLYLADGVGGAPGTLVATSNVVTNPVAAANDFTFATQPGVASSKSYWLALHSSVAWTAYGQNQTAYTLAQPYASGLPSPAGTVTVVTGTNMPQGTFTLAGQTIVVSELVANGDTDYAFSANVNDADLYDCDDLPAGVQTIIGIVTKLYCKKSDAGTRQGQLLLKSGATQVAGVDTVLSTTYTYLSRVDMVDPATSVAWTIAGVNAVQIGQKVTL